MRGWVRAMTIVAAAAAIGVPSGGMAQRPSSPSSPSTKTKRDLPRTDTVRLRDTDPADPVTLIRDAGRIVLSMAEIDAYLQERPYSPRGELAAVREELWRRFRRGNGRADLPDGTYGDHIAGDLLHRGQATVWMTGDASPVPWVAVDTVAEHAPGRSWLRRRFVVPRGAVLLLVLDAYIVSPPPPPSPRLRERTVPGGESPASREPAATRPR